MTSSFQQRELDKKMSENNLNPEHKESRVQTLALIYFNGYRQLLNWQLAVSMAEEAQKFYERGAVQG